MREQLEDFHQRVGVPAAAAAIVEAGGHVRSEAVGVTRRSAPNEPVGTGDQWHIGSCGKAMTAMLFARLVEAGNAEWGTPVAELFGDVGEIDRGWSDVTIDDVLRNRGGVAPNLGPRQMLNAWKSAEPLVEQRTALVRDVLGSAPNTPGRFVYSNLGYTVAGAAIERITSLPYEDALARHVLEPLAISSLGFGAPPVVCGHRPRVRLGPLMAGSGKPMSPDEDHSDNPLATSPAGCMHITIDDWATFVATFLNDGAPLVAGPTLGHLLELPPGEPRSMAMGWGDGSGLDGSYVMQGSNTMWSATVLLSADMDRAALIAANDGRAKTLRASAHLARLLLGSDG